MAATSRAVAGIVRAVIGKVTGTPTRRVLPVLAAVLLLAGCAGTSRLPQHHRPAPPPPPSTAVGRAYLSQLTAEQTELAAAERRFPKQPRTPHQLSRAIGLLAGAMHTLAVGLAGIEPPDTVAPMHKRLITITQRYERQLRQLAHLARSAHTEVAAANGLASDTAAASRAFTRVSASIRRELAQ